MSLFSSKFQTFTFVSRLPTWWRAQRNHVTRGGMSGDCDLTLCNIQADQPVTTASKSQVHAIQLLTHSRLLRNCIGSLRSSQSCLEPSHCPLVTTKPLLDLPSLYMKRSGWLLMEPNAILRPMIKNLCFWMLTRRMGEIPELKSE